MTSTSICVHCAHRVAPDFHFCPGCGHILTQQPLSTSIGKMIFIFLISFCFAPMGLRWVIPYLHQKSPKAKFIGTMALIMTLTSITITIITVKVVMDYYTKLLDPATLKTLHFNY